jgi:hypothetical protein
MGTQPVKPELVLTDMKAVAWDDVKVIAPSDPRAAVEVPVTPGKTDAICFVSKLIADTPFCIAESKSVSDAITCSPA